MAIVTSFHSQETPPKWSFNLRQRIGIYLKDNLPKRYKRLIFLSSVLGLLEATQHPDNELLTKLNQALNLSRNQEAIVFPMLVHSWIWKHRLPDNTIQVDGRSIDFENIPEQTDHHCCEEISNALVNAAPSWLVYSHPTAIAVDLQRMFEEVKHQRTKRKA